MCVAGKGGVGVGLSFIPLFLISVNLSVILTGRNSAAVL